MDMWQKLKEMGAIEESDGVPCPTCGIKHTLRIRNNKYVCKNEHIFYDSTWQHLNVSRKDSPQNL